jgi:drug/metabolite transporter (DMT)-like permease
MEQYWLLFVVLAQFINAFVAIFDKRIIKTVASPLVYAFFTCALSVIAVFAIPFGVHWPDWQTIALSLCASAAFLGSILCIYDALKISSPSEVAPVAGAVTAITTFIFSFFLLGDVLPAHFLVGFGLLVLGMLFISHFELTRRSFLFLVLSGTLWGLSTVLIKMTFSLDPSFAHGFFWTRITNVAMAAILIALPVTRRAFKNRPEAHTPKNKKSSGNYLILVNKFLAGFAFILTLYAIKISNVSLVNALSSLQYVFLLGLALFFGNRMARYFHERRHKAEWLHKIFATSLIIIGFLILFAVS